MIIPPAMINANGFPSWVLACVVIDSDVVTRVTTIAVAKDRRRDGICATNPSPIVRST